MVTAAQRRAVVAEMRDRRALSERQACRYLGLHRTPVRYQARRAPQAALVARLRELAATKVRWGSPRLTWRLVRDGWPVNHKRIERLMCEEQQFVRGMPHVLVCDNGPEFVSQAMDHWAETRSVTLDFIRPGRPVENCFIESFNGRLRDECLNIHHFRTLAEARTVIEAWRTEYNTD